DKRARIYIYDNQKQYQDSMHGPDWSAGLALPREKIIHTYVEAPDFFAAILPHELGHIIFREFVGFNNSAIPLWLEEGLATYQENQLNIFHQAVFGKALRENRLFSLEELSNFDPTSSPDQERVEIYYAQAANIVEYLLKKMSRDKFVTFCRDLRERQDFLRALSRVYSFKDLSELETDWKGYLR
ncbi:MAG: hypothetical protein KKE64_05585, partial [Candidatus Omnitrophica bacterium]|nr:hypothetical protein [Candidatus Omnitrophota bacterium]